MEDLPFGLARQSTYANLSAQDLESMGKRASDAYLCGDCSLNQAIVKLAKEHPSISPHQVQRVVEFANTETFQRMFEKQADDKNIEFPVAEPGVVLRDLNDGARPQLVNVVPPEYGSEPIKTSSVNDVEADLVLAGAFGVELTTPGLEKIAESDKEAWSPAMRVLGQGAKGIWQSLKRGRMLQALKGVKGVASTAVGKPGGWQAGLTMGTPVALGSGYMLGKAASSPADAILLHKMEKEGMISAPMQAMPGKPPEEEHQERIRIVEREIELEEKKQELNQLRQKGQQAMVPKPPPGMAPPPGAAPGGPPPGPLGGPPAGGPPPAGSPMPKMGMALAHAKMQRPHSDLVLADLRQGTSVDSIKQAAAAREKQYPQANPFGDLIRTKQKLAVMVDEASDAVEKNHFMFKEAFDVFQHSVTQHMLGGGGLGEVVHAAKGVTDDDQFIKESVEAVIPHLIDRGLHPHRTRVGMIEYEMEKGAFHRVVNPDHPITQALANMAKLASGHLTLERGLQELEAKYDEVESTLQKAMHAASV